MEEGSDQAGGGSYIYALSEEDAYLQTDEDEKKVLEEPRPDPAWFKCWFCRKRDGEVQRLYGAPFPVRNPDSLAIITLIFICNECVAKFASWSAQERPAPPA